MILKTLLAQPVSFQNAIYLHIDETHAHFLCSCGSRFKLRNSNKARPTEEYRCSKCKREGRMLDHVGERYVFKRIKQDARVAGRDFGLELDWFVKKAHEPCHYCGTSNGNSVTVPSKTGTPLLKNFRYNGLDRIDNEVGYVPENCVPCCIVCNRAKNSMPYGEFLQWINTMIQYRSS